METHQDEPQVVIEHKITKVNGEVGYKRYTKGKLLGKGGFAECYEGLNHETQRMMAMKVIKKSTLQRNRAKQKLLSEIKIHKTLHHKYIVEFDSVFEDSQNVYIILELCTNDTLSKMVKTRKKLTIRETKYFMIQIIQSVEYMHSNRIIHRDLKLGNIFINSQMQVKVGDFGLATKLEFADEKKRTMCGTPNYIAPEIVEGSVGHSYEVDIWSMGVICYAFLFGRPPFETNDVRITYTRIKACQYSFPNSGVPEEAKNFIKKILVLDPKARMTCLQMLAHPFLSAQDIPKYLPVEALTSVPTFRASDEPENLNRVNSTERLRPEDFGNRFKLELNVNQAPTNMLEGIQSPRNAFNERSPTSAASPPLTVMNDQHRINVLTYVDYSRKYGVGYVINNRYYGVYFNDDTVISTDQSKQEIHFIENPTARVEQIKSYKSDAVPTDRDFQKKMMLLERFITHLNDEMAKMPESKLTIETDNRIVYVKQWLKTKHAIMFGLSNKLFQVNFFDSSQILLQTERKTVLFTSKRGEKTYELLSNVLQSQQSEMARRIKYTKQILNSIQRRNEQHEQVAV